MDSTILQIPVTKQLRSDALKAAERQGFSSLQEVVRVFLNQFANQNINVTFSFPPVALSSTNEKRYEKMVADVASKKTKTKRFNNVADLIKDLNV